MTYLVFLDEFQPEDRRYSQISGFVIRIEDYVQLRTAVLRDHIVTIKVDNPSSPYVPHAIPCYKWSDFIRDAVNDDYRINKLEVLFRVLFENAQMVFCYGVHGPLPFTPENIPFANLRYCWGQLQWIINSLQTDGVLIPVVDLGLNEAFSSQYDLYSVQNYPALNSLLFLGESCVTLKNPQNCLEPFFAKDEFSVGVQLADLIGGFRLFNSKLGDHLSEFNIRRKAVLEKWVSNPLTTCIFESWDSDDSGLVASYHDSVHKGKTNTRKETGFG